MQYAWFVWSLFLLILWLIIYTSIFTDEGRREMRIVSSWGVLLGFAQFFFVPDYWTPQSLFGLSARFGLDIESFIFAFCIAGIASAIYEWFVKTGHDKFVDIKNPDQKHNILNIISTALLFLALVFLTKTNPIYAGSISLLIGAFTIGYERRDLIKKILVGGVLFSVFYFIILFALTTIYPDFLLSVLNISVLSAGGTIADIPWSQIFFPLSYGFFFAGIYEYVFKRMLVSK